MEAGKKQDAFNAMGPPSPSPMVMVGDAGRREGPRPIPAVDHSQQNCYYYQQRVRQGRETSRYISSSLPRETPLIAPETRTGVFPDVK